MSEADVNSEGIEGEDFVVLTPEKNVSTILLWDLRLVNNTKHSIRIDFRHSNLMMKMLIISDKEETNGKSALEEQKIAQRIGKEI